MKKLIFGLFTIAFIACSVSSCKKKSSGSSNNNNTNTGDGTITVEVPITKTKTMTDSIAPIPVAIPFPGIAGLMQDTFATKVDEMLTTYAPGVTKDKIIKIWPSSFQAVIDDNSGQNFDFIDDSVYVYLDKYNGTSPRLVAYARGIQKGAKTINFTVIEDDVKDLFYNDYLQINMRFGIPANSSLKKNSNFTTNLVFKIKSYQP